MFLSLWLLFIPFSDAFSLQNYQAREKSFQEWQEAQKRFQEMRKATAEKQRQDRLQRELSAIRRRQSFRREYRTTAHLEAEYLAKYGNRENVKSSDRDLFAKNHKALIDYYEKNILPLKNKEYDLPDLSKQEDHQ